MLQNTAACSTKLLKSYSKDVKSNFTLFFFWIHFKWDGGIQTHAITKKKKNKERKTSIIVSW